MRKAITLITMFIICSVCLFSQTAIIDVEAMSDFRVRYELKKTVALASNRWTTTGYPVAAPNTFIWLSGRLSNTTAITSYAWSLTTRPSGSTATLNDDNQKMMNFAPDVAGAYTVTLAINGSISTTKTIYCGPYVGVGTITDESFVAGTANRGGECAYCHSSMGTEGNDWAKTKHATLFKRGILGQSEFEEVAEGVIANPGGQYMANCVPCHVTGYNSGFDNTVASSSGFLSRWWQSGFTAPDTAGSSIRKMFSLDGSRWTSLTREQKQLATIGCESCHGPYFSQHRGEEGIISDMKDGACHQCHEAVYNHGISRQFLGSGHANLIQTYNTTNTACLKCHSGRSFLTFVKAQAAGEPTPNTIYAGQSTERMTCVVCHDPHKADHEYQLRVAVSNLANGTAVTAGGDGKLCMNCHQSRVNAATVAITGYVWGTRGFSPHYAPQADLFLGQNMCDFDEDYKFSIKGQMSHNGVKNSCATCHMHPTPYEYGGPLLPGVNQIGGHTFKLKGPRWIPDGAQITQTDSTIIDHVAACADCHGPISKFDDIIARDDYDGDEKLESFAQEFEGLYLLLEETLMKSPYNLQKNTSGYVALRETSVSTNDSIAMATYPNLRKAFFNYLSFHYDNSKGIHNPKFAMNVLLRSLNAIKSPSGIVQPDNQIPAVYSLSPNYPNPFNPSTKIDFSVPKDGNVKINIFNINGQLVATLYNSYTFSGNYTVTWDGKTSDGAIASSGIYFYQLRAPNNTVITKKMSLVK
jgi:hypothetical protein